MSDAIGRLGASEFAVVAPSTESAGAVRLAERIQQAVASASLEETERPHLQVRAGYCAVADFAASPVDAVEMLVRAASALRQSPGGGQPAMIQAFDEGSSRF
jgi:diguanylate cyclase (GGDEF)-like protein